MERSYTSACRQNALMNAKPFVIYIVAGFITIGIAETLHHIPGLEVFNAFGFEHIALQLILNSPTKSLV